MDTLEAQLNIKVTFAFEILLHLSISNTNKGECHSFKDFFFSSFLPSVGGNSLLFFVDRKTTYRRTRSSCSNVALAILNR